MTAFHTLTVLPDGVQFELPEGSCLTDIEYETSARIIAFGCRSGACGACMVEVVEGGAALGAAADEEIEFLEELGGSRDQHRLACQCRLYGAATILVADG
jgi:ferredoxin